MDQKRRLYREYQKALRAHQVIEAEVNFYVRQWNYGQLPAEDYPALLALFTQLSDATAASCRAARDFFEHISSIDKSA